MKLKVSSSAVTVVYGRRSSFTIIFVLALTCRRRLSLLSLSRRHHCLSLISSYRLSLLSPPPPAALPIIIIIIIIVIISR